MVLTLPLKDTNWLNVLNKNRTQHYIISNKCINHKDIQRLKMKERTIIFQSRKLKPSTFRAVIKCYGPVSLLCQQMNEKVWYKYTMKYYSVIKMNESCHLWENKTGRHHVNQSKPITERQVSQIFSHMWKLKRKKKASDFFLLCKQIFRTLNLPK